MKDTSSKMHQEMIRRMKSLSGAQRLKMGCSMFDSAKKLVIASLGGVYEERTLRGRLFRRMYDGDFHEEKMKKIIAHLERH